MDKKILRWNFIFQYGWVLTNLFNSILLLPLYIKNIDANTLGVWLATSSILSWMALVDPGIGEVLQQNIAEMRGKHMNDEIGRSIGSGYIASSFIVLLAIVVGFGCYFSLGVIINKDVTQYPHLATALTISIIATGLSLVSWTISGINQGLHNAADVAISSLSANFLFLIVNIFFLYLGYGVVSIALANLIRSVYINIYNIISMNRFLKKENMHVVFSRLHFKKFIKIFSFTSASKIISGLSYSVDMVVLARFIPPSMITMYEINKRPVNITNSLIGRHSVALMPLISHAKGSNDTPAIIQLINKQFKLYAYAALYVSFMFCINYKNLITVWTGASKYAGNTIMYLLVTYGFIGLICYFMSNVQYALGDIKSNSLFNIIRNFFYGIVMFFAAREYGIIGTLIVSVSLATAADFFFYAYRVYKLGYLQTALIKNTFATWSIIIPCSLLAGWMIKSFALTIVAADAYFSQMVIASIIFSVIYLLLLYVIDNGIRSEVKIFIRRLTLNFA
jgi:O-antigen/teichoic acid export membrane protein